MGLFGEIHSDIPQPEDRGILLKDILEEDVDEKYYLSEQAITRLLNIGGEGFSSKIKEGTDKGATVISSQHKLTRGMDIVCVAMRGRGKNNTQQLEPSKGNKTNCLTSVSKDNLVMQLNPSKESGGRQPYQQNRVYDPEGKMPALCAGPKDNNILGGCVKFGRTEEAKQLRRESMKKGIDHTPFAKKEITGVDYEKMNTLTTVTNKDNLLLVPEATIKGYVEIEPGQCVDLENPRSKTRRGRKMEEKSNCLMASKTNFHQYTHNYRLRRLTPTECARLQTIPTWYRWDISDTAIYRQLGNGWTIEVIKHILKFLTGQGVVKETKASSLPYPTHPPIKHPPLP